MDIPSSLIRNTAFAMGEHNSARKTWEKKYQKDLYKVYWNISVQVQKYNSAIFETRLHIAIFCATLIFFLAHLTGRRGDGEPVVSTVCAVILCFTGTFSYLSWKHERILGKEIESDIADLAEFSIAYTAFKECSKLKTSDMEKISPEELAAFCKNRLIEQATKIIALEIVKSPKNIIERGREKSYFNAFYTHSQALGVELKPHGWFYQVVMIHTTEPHQ